MVNNGGLSFVLSVIYGDNTQSSRKELWQDPKQLCASQRSVPLILLRDFDVCRFADKRMEVNPYLSRHHRISNDCITHCSLTDLSVGSSWSWHNNTHGNARIFGKIDRVLCNVHG